MIDVCCGLSASPALFVPPVNPCTCTLVAMLVLAGCLALSFSIFFALSGVAVTHIVLRGITITLVARTLRSVVVVACTRTTNVGHDRRRGQRGSEEVSRNKAIQRRTCRRRRCRGIREKLVRRNDLRRGIYPRPSAWWFVCTGARCGERIDTI